MTEVKINRASPHHIQELKKFFFEYGPTEHNIVDPSANGKEFDQIDGGRTVAFMAHLGPELIGVATCNTHRKFPQYEDDPARLTGYFSQYVVKPSQQGRGIGTRLIQASTEFLISGGIEAIYVTHHADNIASSRALEKAGYAEVDTFDDLEKRPTGSRKTTIRRFTKSAV